ncbi:MAG: hypothetical protein PHG96_07310 [Kiritimatiellae bacterium]|nr:hypothetical protein [Kiritimatiellia bacterium]
MTSFGLLGSNETAACVFSGEVTGRDAGGTNYCFFLEKAGSGIWRFADSDNNKTKRSFWSSMAIRGFGGRFKIKATRRVRVCI